MTDATSTVDETEEPVKQGGFLGTIERIGKVLQLDPGLLRAWVTVRGRSDDALEWKTYEFKWKPGALDRAPRFVEPHQPRLDWQMWFAALSDVRQNPWFLALAFRLLENAPEVTNLLGTNPFPDKPPRYLRAEIYRYRFTTVAEHRRSGAWWQREAPRIYLPPVSLRGE